MIAALPMYDRPETSAAYDAWWSTCRDLLRRHGIDAPDHLTRDGDVWAQWRSPDLLLGQTCNLPFRAELHHHLTLVGNPDLGLPDTPAGFYHSVIITRCDASPGPTARLAFNDPMSQSGWAAAQGLAFTDTIATGAHRASAQAVADGHADLAAIDAHTWRDLLRFDPVLTNHLKVIARTAPTPALPYVTAQPQLVGILAKCLSDALGALSQTDSALLNIKGLVPVPLAAHLQLPLPPSPTSRAN